MGIYINPPDCSKEKWLQKNGDCLGPHAPVCLDPTGNCFHVCLVNNGPFSAAGVAFDETELRVFSMPDERPRLWFIVTRAKLFEITDIKLFAPL